MTNGVEHAIQSPPTIWQCCAESWATLGVQVQVSLREEDAQDCPFECPQHSMPPWRCAVSGQPAAPWPCDSQWILAWSLNTWCWSLSSWLLHLPLGSFVLWWRYCCLCCRPSIRVSIVLWWTLWWGRIPVAVYQLLQILFDLLCLRLYVSPCVPHLFQFLHLCSGHLSASLLLSHNHVVACGDLNIDTFDSTQPFNKSLENFITSHSVSRPISQPTRNSETRCSVPDHFTLH